jgi:hypothetical protein
VLVGFNFRSLVAAVLAVAALGVLALQEPASATTIGPDLSAETPKNVFSCNIPGGCTYSQETPTYTSPISGTVVGWMVSGSKGPLSLRIISGNTGGASSTVQSPPTFGVECFPTALPISAGDRIGVDLPAGFVSDLGVSEPAGSSVDGWTPQLGNGQSRAPNHAFPSYELLLDAIIQPLSGPSAGCPPTGQPTGQRAATLKRCKKRAHKKHWSKKRLKKCKRRAKRLPL